MGSVKLNVKQGKVSNQGVLCPYSICMCIFSQSTDIPQLAQHLYSGRSSTSKILHKWELSIHPVKYKCVYKALQLEAKLQHPGTRFVTVKQPYHLCYCPSISSTRISEMLFQFLYFLTIAAYESAWLEIVYSRECVYIFHGSYSNWKTAGCLVLIHSLMQMVTVLVFWLQSCVRPFTQMWWKFLLLRSYLLLVRRVLFPKSSELMSCVLWRGMMAM